MHSRCTHLESCELAEGDTKIPPLEQFGCDHIANPFLHKLLLLVHNTEPSCLLLVPKMDFWGPQPSIFTAAQST